MNRKFTLIELLVTIAVIAVLAALLFPALNMAKEKATAINCRNNVKTCSMAVLSYGDTYNGYVPLASGNPVPEDRTGSWAWVLLLSGELKNGKPLTCPAVLFRSGYCVETTYALTKQKVLVNTEPVPWRSDYGGYAFNPMVTTLSGLYPRARLGSFRNPSQKIMLGDGRCDYDGKPGGGTRLAVNLDGGVAQTYLYGWHALTANMAFYDGHVEGIRGRSSHRMVFAESVYNTPRFKWENPTAANLNEVAARSAWMLK